MSASALGPGDSLGRYRVVELLGRGGMGAVYKATDEGGGLVALKVMASELAAQDRLVSRFRREAEALAAVRHPGVVAVRSVEEVSGTPFIVMELLTGGTLKDRLRRGPLPWAEAAGIGARIARALAAVHGAGFVHRDVKPENVLLGADGQPRLSDFGLVGFARGAVQGGSLTRTGELLGTLEYMAPEQADGKISLGPATDLYALGALVYALVAGRPPFEGTGYELVKKHAVDPPRPLREVVPEVPEGLDRLVLSLLEKAPEKRPQAAAAVADALEALATGRAPVLPSRRKRRIAPVVVLLVLLLACAGAAAWHVREERRKQKEAEEREARLAQARRYCTVATELLRKRKLDAAYAEANRAVGLEPGLALAWERRGTVLHAKLDDEGAIQDLSHAIELDPGFTAAWTHRSQARLAKDLDGARSDAVRATELDPSFAEAWASIAGVHGKKGDNEAAIKAALRATELDPNLALGWSNLGVARFNAGDMAGAIPDLDRAIALDGRDVETLFCRGSAKLAQGDIVTALSDLSRAIVIAPGDKRLFMMRSQARLRIPAFEAAIADATRAIELDPKDADAYVIRADAELRKRGDFDQVLADCEKALVLDPANRSAWLLRTDLHRKLGDAPGMIQDWAQGVAREPKNAWRWANLAAVQLEVGQFHEAVADASRAIELAPEDARPRSVRALARRRTGDRTGAIEDAKRYVEMAPEGVDAPRMKALISELDR